MTDPRSATARPRSIPARVHGTYLVAPPTDGADPTAALVGFHGYGERAEHHLAELAKIPGAERWLLVAVQALHPFYKRSGEVVASWMTSFDRDHAIADNVAYALAVIDELARHHPSLQSLALIGFSQGVAMAYRAAAALGERSDGAPLPVRALVALAGDVPPEVETGGLERLPPVLLAAGRKDDWFGPQELDRDAARLRAGGARVETLLFAGGHEWTGEVFARAGEFLAERLEGPDPSD